MKKFLTPQELAEEAKNLSNFGGSEFVSGYTGEDDHMLSFEGSIQNFAAEGSLNDQFTFTLANSATVARTACLWAGYLKGNATLAPGQMTDGAFNDTAGNAGLTGTSNVTGKTIAELLAYLQFANSTLVRMKVIGGTAVQINNDILIQDIVPFRDGKSNTISPRLYQDQMVQQTTIVQMPLPAGIVMDNNHKFLYQVAASNSATLTLWFGASINLGKSLTKKVNKAYNNIQRMGVNRVKQASIAKRIA